MSGNVYNINKKFFKAEPFATDSWIGTGYVILKRELVSICKTDASQDISAVRAILAHMTGLECRDTITDENVNSIIMSVLSAERITEYHRTEYVMVFPYERQGVKEVWVYRSNDGKEVLVNREYIEVTNAQILYGITDSDIATLVNSLNEDQITAIFARVKLPYKE